MDSTRIGIAPLILCLAVVVGLEMAAQWIDTDPYLVTAAIRLLDIFVILGIIYGFHKGFHGIGLSREGTLAGIRSGIIWSVGFGVLVLLAAAILALTGIAPLSLIRVQVPPQLGRLILLLLVGGIIGPVAEEIVFRGLIYSFFRRWGFIVALLSSTSLFVLLHHLTTGIPVPQIVGGIVFAVAFETSKSLYSPMIIHSLGNLALFGVGMANQWI